MFSVVVEEHDAALEPEAAKDAYGADAADGGFLDGFFSQDFQTVFRGKVVIVGPEVWKISRGWMTQLDPTDSIFWDQKYRSESIAVIKPTERDRSFSFWGPDMKWKASRVSESLPILCMR